MSPGKAALVGLITLVALVLSAQTRIRSLQWGYDYPLMSKHDPTRALFELAERSRRAAQSKALPSWWLAHGECAACDAATLETRWSELFQEHEVYVAEGYKRFATRRWRQEAEVARDVSLAAWGSAEHLTAVKQSLSVEVPDYLEARRAEVLRGDLGAEQARIELEGRRGLRQACVHVAFMLFALGAYIAYRRGFRYPRRPLRARLPALSLGHGLLIFIWATAFVSVVNLWRADNPHGLLAEFPLLMELTPALTVSALLVGTRAARASTPIRDLLRCPPDWRSRYWIAIAASAAIGVVYAFDWLDWRALHWLGALRWSESLRDAHLEHPRLDAFSAVVLAPFAEELLFRGVLFGALTTRLSLHRSALISCLVFAAVHGRGIYGFASVAVGGYLWARLAARTGSLVPSMLGHGLFNFVVEVLRALAGA